MLTQNQIMLFRCKRLMKLSAKGEVMSELQKFFFDTMKGVKDGTCPTETAKEIHLTGHRLVMDKFADCKKIDRGMKDEALSKALDAMREV
jgi:hypothetical protein